MAAVAPVVTRPSPITGWRVGREVALVLGLWLAYSGSRLVADDSFAPARERAARLLDVERLLGLDREHAVTSWFLKHDTFGTLAAFQYASAHYVVSALVLVWLWRRGPDAYLPARRALIVATVLGLVCYLLLPTAPPRLVGFPDLLDLHSASGWWGGDASAPRGLGGMTNQLAAFPSLHAGWSLWVALVLQRWAGPRVAALGWAHATITAVVVVGTGNHWVLDVLVGWAVVGAAWAACTSTRPARAGSTVDRTSVRASSRSGSAA